MTSSFETFFALIDHLKEKGTHATGAAKAINVKPSTVRAWRQRKSGPKEKHVHDLINAFPNQLKEKAEDLGILVKPSLLNEERTLLLLQNAKQRIEELELTIAAMQDDAADKAELKAENDRLRDQVNTLLATLKKKIT